MIRTFFSGGSIYIRCSHHLGLWGVEYYQAKEGIQKNWTTRVLLYIFFEEGGGEITGIDGYPYLKHLIEFLDRGLGGAAGKD